MRPPMTSQFTIFNSGIVSLKMTNRAGSVELYGVQFNLEPVDPSYSPTRNFRSDTVNSAISSRPSLKKTASARLRIEGLTAFASDKNLEHDYDKEDTLDTWLITNSVPKSNTLSVLRSSFYHQDFYSQTGCHEYGFQKDGVIHHIHFLREWTNLWNSLINHESAYVRGGCPLLYYCIVLFFNTKVLCLTVLLSVYYGLVRFVSYSFWPSAVTAITQAVAVLCMGLCVIISAFVVKGSFFGPILVKKREKDEEKVILDRENPIHLAGGVPVEPIVSNNNEKSATTGGNIFDNSSHSHLSKTELEETNNKFKVDTIRNSIFNIIKLFFTYHRKTTNPQKHSRKMKKSGLIQVTGFFDLIEGATKYLHTIGYEKHPFRPRIYTTYFLQFVITVSSLFFVANILYHWITIAKSKCHITVSDIHLVGDYDHACSRYTFELIMYGGYVISNIGWWLLFMTLGTLIATLMYGADVANALTLYWLLRFRPLRRIEERHLETHSYKAADKHMDKNMVDGEEQSADNNSTINNANNINNTANANNTNSYGNSVGGSVKFGSFYGEEMDEIITDNKTMSELQVLIKRDAYERYLFTQNYMQIAGDIWSLLLILILLICIGIFVYTYYLTLYTVTTLNQPVSLTLVSICCASVVLFGFIVNLVAYANAAVDKILDGFLYSSTEDYILIGKRDEWISFVRESPMFWKIFGLSVTQAWIGNFLAGSMSSVVGGFLIAASYKK